MKHHSDSVITSQTSYSCWRFQFCINFLDIFHLFVSFVSATEPMDVDDPPASQSNPERFVCLNQSIRQNFGSSCLLCGSS